MPKTSSADKDLATFLNRSEKYSALNKKLYLQFFPNISKEWMFLADHGKKMGRSNQNHIKGFI